VARAVRDDRIVKPRLRALIPLAFLLTTAAALAGADVSIERDVPLLLVDGTSADDDVEISATSGGNLEIDSESPIANRGCRRLSSNRARCNPSRVETLRFRMRRGNDSAFLTLGPFANDIRGIVVGGPGGDRFVNSRNCRQSGRRAPGLRLVGGKQHDALHGGDGGDQLLGGNGDDKLFGTNCDLDGDDFFSGGRGDDVLSAGDGDDVVRGGPGRDRCVGGRGTDRIYGCERMPRPHSG
jgi:Ca2+-binding RTX toxin-like protein